MGKKQNKKAHFVPGTWNTGCASSHETSSTAIISRTSRSPRAPWVWLGWGVGGGQRLRHAGDWPSAPWHTTKREASRAHLVALAREQRQRLVRHLVVVVRHGLAVLDGGLGVGLSRATGFSAGALLVVCQR